VIPENSSGSCSFDVANTVRYSTATTKTLGSAHAVADALMVFVR